jgi:class 3 adenylate cyclase
METWGDGSRILSLSPSEHVDESMRKWYGELERLSIPPGSIPVFQQMMATTDVLDVLPAIQAPTLVIQRAQDRFADPRHGRYVAAHVPGAKLLELPGDETLMPMSGGDAYLDEVEEFLTGTRRAPRTDRVLATVLFTDIVDSTGHAAKLGDSAWRELLGRHDRLVRAHVERHRGRFVKSLGDGILATFDGPARAIRGALDISRTVSGLGLEVRAGVHTGEVEVLGDDVGGMAVHIGARVSALAGPGEVLVSSTVKDLVVGSGIGFAERGEHALKGVPGEWRIFRAEG